MALNKVDISCGVLQLSHIAWNRPEGALHDLLRENKRKSLKRKHGVYSTSRPAHVIFSDAKHNSHLHLGGEGLATFITQNNLGSVVRSKGARNTNSDNTIYVWVWTVDWKALRAWAESNPDPREEWQRRISDYAQTAISGS